jgi:hypothetical protein
VTAIDTLFYGIIRLKAEGHATMQHATQLIKDTTDAYPTLRTLAISIFPFQLTVSRADVEVVIASDVSTVKPHKNACLFALCRSSCRHSIVKKCSTNITSKRLCLLVCIITNIVQNSTADAFHLLGRGKIEYSSTVHSTVK